VKIKLRDADFGQLGGELLRGGEGFERFGGWRGIIIIFWGFIVVIFAFKLGGI
jgi:hypothetical protein